MLKMHRKKSPDFRFTSVCVSSESTYLRNAVDGKEPSL